MSFFDKFIYVFRSALERYWYDNAMRTSSALAYSTLLALVPLVAVVVSVISALPMFSEMSDSLREFAFKQLVPEAAGSIVDYIDQFVAGASKLTMVGGIFLIITSLNLLHSTEEVFNDIFNTHDGRNFLQRVVMYWAMLTLMPILFGLSLSISSYMMVKAQEIVGDFSFGQWALGELLPVVLVAIAYAMLFVCLPSRPIKFSAAVIGGIVGSILFDIAKSGFALWISQANNYTVIYGALATFPIFLIWLWICWLVTLFAAYVASEVNDFDDYSS